jgi:hypothetical protein
MAPGDVLPHPQSNVTAHHHGPPPGPASAQVHVLPPPKVRRQKIPAMPPEIAGAIAEVQKSIRKIGKDGHNNDGGNYRFASVDSFFAFLGPLLGEHGLVIDVDEAEDGFEYYVLTKTYRNGGSSDQHWMRARYVFTLAHRSGATWDHNPVRTVDVLNTGPQAYGSAQSYATKMYLRTLFKIPTGEREDADYHETDRDTGHGPGESGTGRWNREEPRRVPQGDQGDQGDQGRDDAPRRITPREIGEFQVRVRAGLEAAADVAAVNELWLGNRDRLKEIRDADDDAYEAAKELFRLRKAELVQADAPPPPNPADDAPGDPWPTDGRPGPTDGRPGPAPAPALEPLPPRPFTVEVTATSDGKFIWDLFAQRVLDIVPRIPDRGWSEDFFSRHAVQLRSLSKVADMVGIVGGETLTGREAAERIAQARDARLAELDAQAQAAE